MEVPPRPTPGDRASAWLGELLAMTEDSTESVRVLELPPGRLLPLNSRRLTGRHIRAIAEALQLPTKASIDELRQLIDGKLAETERDSQNVQVLESRESGLLFLLDETGVFLETTSKTAEFMVELEGLRQERDEMAQVNDELRKRHGKEVAHLTQALEARRSGVEYLPWRRGWLRARWPVDGSSRRGRYWLT